MKRDMDLVRKILIEIEEKYFSTALYNLKIDGYDKETVAYHCKIMYDAGLIFDYKAQYAGNMLFDFGVGGLTWEGNDYLDKVRDDTMWNKTKGIIKEKGLPLIFDTIKSVASTIISSATEGAVTAYLNQGGTN